MIDCVPGMLPAKFQVPTTPPHGRGAICQVIANVREWAEKFAFTFFLLALRGVFPLNDTLVWDAQIPFSLRGAIRMVEGQL